MISSNDNVQKWLKNQTLRWDLLCSSHQHAGPFPDYVERASLLLNAVAERWRRRSKCKSHRESTGHVSMLGLSGSLGISCTHWLRISHCRRKGRVSKGCDEGQWLRLPYLGWRKKQRHESPIKPVRKGQLLSRRLIWDWLIAKRKSDGGMQETVFLEEMFQSLRDERED